MLRMAVYYKEADNPDFEAGYVQGHLPLIRGYENIQNYVFYSAARKVMGEFPYSHVFVGSWTDKDAWKADMGSVAAKEATDDAQQRVTQPFDVVVFDQVDAWSRS